MNIRKTIINQIKLQFHLIIIIYYLKRIIIIIMY